MSQPPVTHQDFIRAFRDALGMFATGIAVVTTRSDDEFAGLDIDDGLHCMPLLKNCCARLECRNTARHEGNDHLVFISEVVRFDREDRAPLVYRSGAYRRLAAL